MAHLRSRIFATYRQALAAIPEFSGDGKVARGRAAAIPQEMLPALTLTWAEANEADEIRPFSGPAGEDGYDRLLPLMIIVHLRDDEAEEEFDRICTLIEPVMAAHMVLPGLTVETLMQSQRFYVQPTTGLPLGAGSIAYQVRYKTTTDPQISAL
ncbi:MAG: hypothetical protein QHC90_25900 [Shinella sp.]|nr:hypothetical protein [Shinella sp.]